MTSTPLRGEFVAQAIGSGEVLGGAGLLAGGELGFDFGFGDGGGLGADAEVGAGEGEEVEAEHRIDCSQPLELQSASSADCLLPTATSIEYVKRFGC